MTNQYTATVYTRPGCMKCRATIRAISRMGIPVTVAPIDDDQRALGIMADHGWAELPLVEVHGPGETFTWAGMNSSNLRALEYLMKEAA
ncbi:glutaredoxin domain-containing protein [Corynebacterium phoceense]